MTQVFILGVLVALVKLAHLAHVVPGVALWAFGGLIVLLTAAGSTFNMHEMWNLVTEKNERF
jgi:paraquat-inducible protein A